MACGLNKGRIEPCKDVVGGKSITSLITEILLLHTIVQMSGIQLKIQESTAYKYELASIEQTTMHQEKMVQLFFIKT